MAKINNIRLHYINLIKSNQKGLLATFFYYILSIFSIFYGLLVKLLSFYYDTGFLRSYRSCCSVISIGNITWGGTGKTPLVQAIAGCLQSQGKRPVILIRGYGSDESCMLERKLADIPVLAGKDRVKTAMLARERYQADTLILDDGFQHRRLQRDHNIVLIDAHCPFGNRQLIPRGMLREPLTALGRATAFVLTKTDFAVTDTALAELKKELKIYNRNAPIYEAAHYPFCLYKLNSEDKIGLETIKKQKFALLAAIGDPLYFQHTVQTLEAEISLQFYFTDHHHYSIADIRKIEESCAQAQIKQVITTEKDAVKLSAILQNTDWQIEFLVLSIRFRIKEEKDFFALLTNRPANRQTYAILLLSDGRAGHVNQSAAVARMIERRMEQQTVIARAEGPKQSLPLRHCGEGETVTLRTVEIRFKNRLYRFLLSLCAAFSGKSYYWDRGCLSFCLQRESFDMLRHSPADVVVSAGTALAAVNLFISGINKAKKIALMKPPPFLLSRFDLVITPEHDRIEKRENVLFTRIAPNLIDPPYLQRASERLTRLLPARTHRGPVIGLLIGGDNAGYKITLSIMQEVVAQIKSAAGHLDGELLITTSRRTPLEIEEFLRNDLAGLDCSRLLVLANRENVPDAVGGILGLSDIVIVSAESISMLSEAVSAGRYVLTFSLEKKKRKATKQERFLDTLVKDGLVKATVAEKLSAEIEYIWRNKPEKKVIADRDRICRAIDRILLADF